jgi:hypothetical protein
MTKPVITNSIKHTEKEAKWRVPNESRSPEPCQVNKYYVFSCLPMD